MNSNTAYSMTTDLGLSFSVPIVCVAGYALKLLMRDCLTELEDLFIQMCP